MQAIRTKYVGPGNVKGSAIIARCEAGSIRFGYDSRLNLDENHEAAMLALRAKLGWTVDKGYPPMVGGTFDGVMCWVFLPKGV